jgi:hypothetical protein
MSWILAQRMPVSALGSFPMHEGSPVPKALSWCLGDLGIARALHLAGGLIGEPSWQTQALALADDVAAFAPTATTIDDACLCHGAAGMGLLFQRLHADTGASRFADAARAWYRQALSRRDDTAEWGGFYYLANRHPAPEKRRDGSFLLGAGGVALAFLAAAGAREPTWDRLLLASVRAHDAGPRGDSTQLR